MKNLNNYQIVFQDYWDLFKRYSNVTEDDLYWKNLSDDAFKLYERHGKVQVSMEMSLVVLTELERIFKVRKGGKDA